MKITLRLPLLALASAGLLVACGDDPTGSSDPASRSSTGLEGGIAVSAAASLTEAFTQIGDDFAAANPGVEVTFNFDSSSALVAQILEGAPADVVASADEVTMAELTDAGLVAGEPEAFARNELVIVTGPGNPEGITGLADLTDAGIISLCGEDVPCGRAATQALDAAGVTIAESSITRGQNVKATLTAVTEGDAVAGIVYVTDATAAGDRVEAVTIPAADNAVVTYPIGVLASSGEPGVAAAFLAHVLGDDGQAVLEEHGFLPPR